MASWPKTKSRTGSSSPDSGRSSSTQWGLGRNRQSRTRSASRGRPCLYPNDTTDMRMPESDSSPKRSVTRWRSWLTLSSAGVDHDVGPGPDRLQEATLVGDGLGHLPLQDGMAAPGPLEPPHQDVLGGVEVDELDPVSLGSQRVDGGEGLFDTRPAAPSEHEGHPVLGGPGPAHDLGHLAQQGGGHVVDHVPAGVLEGCRGRGPSRPRHAGDDQVVAHVRPSSAAGPVAPSPAWGVGTVPVPSWPRTGANGVTETGIRARAAGTWRWA